MKGRCVCGCGRRAGHDHHCVYRQHLRHHGGDPRDRRNIVRIAYGCHGAHHARAKPLPLRVLPDAVFEFAAELMGGPAAHAYLARFYAGGDPRHDALLEGEAA